MSEGPKVTVHYVCDGCDHLAREIKTSFPPWYTSHCTAPLAPPDRTQRVLLPMSQEPHIDIPTPAWCPYRIEAVRAALAAASGTGYVQTKVYPLSEEEKQSLQVNLVGLKP